MIFFEPKKDTHKDYFEAIVVVDKAKSSTPVSILGNLSTVGGTHTSDGNASRTLFVKHFDQLLAEVVADQMMQLIEKKR